MPTYEYRCQQDHQFEVFQRISEDPVASCPECGADAQRQISGGAGFLFKGDGFYITDYRSDDYKKKASSESSASESSASKDTASESSASTPASPSASKDPASGGSSTSSSSD